MRKITLVAILISLATISARSQGCSDAGACSIGGMKTVIGADSARYSSVIAGVSVGLGDEKVLITSPIVEANFNVLKDTWLHLRLPFIFTSGNLGNTAGLGDIFAGVSQRIFQTQNIDMRVLAAGKIPLNRARKQSSGTPLPMPYQTSLGTYDMILGSSIQAGPWHVAAAYQGILKHNNQNNFLREFLPSDLENQQYFNSRNLERANDIMLRVERRFALGPNQLVAGILPIYHLSEDSYQALNGERIKLSGSDGLTLNLTASFMYQTSANAGIRFTAAAPAVTRKVRPDGLTRFAVGMLNYELRF